MWDIYTLSHSGLALLNRLIERRHGDKLGQTVQYFFVEILWKKHYFSEATQFCFD